jgi:hypothetical protein
MIEYCVCGHLESDHGIYSYGVDACWNCSIKTGRHSHSFKLDNLRLVEDIAKQKGLI